MKEVLYLFVTQILTFCNDCADPGTLASLLNLQCQGIIWIDAGIDPCPKLVQLANTLGFLLVDEQ